MGVLETKLHRSQPQEMNLTTDGGHSIVLRLFQAENSGSVVIMAGAMGVAQNCYEKFARFLNGEGFTVITFDYSGMGRR